MEPGQEDGIPGREDGPLPGQWILSGKETFLCAQDIQDRGRSGILMRDFDLLDLPYRPLDPYPFQDAILEGPSLSENHPKQHPTLYHPLNHNHPSKVMQVSVRKHFLLILEIYKVLNSLNHVSFYS